MKVYYPEGFGMGTNENKKYVFTKAQLLSAMQSGEILEGLVYMCDSAHNLLLNLGCMKGIIPRFEGAVGISHGATRDIALISRVGKAVCFVVEDIKTDKDGTQYALLSRRIAQQRCFDEFLLGLIPGDIIPAKVTHLETFGAFCDVGCGNIALLPIDSISVSRISHPKDRFSVGDDIKVIVKNIDEQGRITLSHKELLGTWKENADTLSQGETVSGVIRSIESYGIFIELCPNLAGLAEPKEGVKVGQTASVYIKSIIPDKMKVKLIIIDNFDSDYSNKIKYFYEGKHIDSFLYSPENSSKKIETMF